MNVLVTGGKGFVGTAFCNKIKENFKDISLFAPSSRELDLLDLKNVCKYLKEKERFLKRLLGTENFLLLIEKDF